MERVILTTGGTGGHIFPALAVAEELKSRRPRAKVLFVGGSFGPEGEFARQAGVDFVGLPVRGVLGRGFKAVGAALLLALGLLRGAWIVLWFRPDVVLGFGGYAGFASVMAAALLGKPTAIHEQNSVPGLTNRILGPLVKRVFLSFPDTGKRLNPSKVRLTGNPVRKQVSLSVEPGARPEGSGKRLLVLGGSQGARALNTAVVEGLSRLDAAGAEVLHQCGKADFERVAAEYEAKGLAQNPRFQLTPFIENMGEAYAWADLAICRAGATTVAELAVAGKPSILVPFPFATHDHQRRNARFLEHSGAAAVIEEKDIGDKDLIGAALQYLGNPVRLLDMSRAARSVGRADAAARVVRELESISKTRFLTRRSGASRELIVL